MTLVKITARQLAEIAEKSSGYTVEIFNADSNTRYTLSNIRFYRRNGRRVRTMVEITYTAHGVSQDGLFDDETEFSLID